MIKEMLLKIIEEKYDAVGLNTKNKTNVFWKIKEFEGNAIGQIGEAFIKQLFDKLEIPLDDKRKVIHDEYDILSSGQKIEIKTARKGAKNNTFQFNGINPKYNYDWIIFIGIWENGIVYRIINKNKIKYIHKERKYFVDLDTNKKQLVKMNPNNEVNFKITLNWNDMLKIDSFIDELGDIFK